MNARSSPTDSPESRVGGRDVAKACVQGEAQAWCVAARASNECQITVVVNGAFLLHRHCPVGFRLTWPAIGSVAVTCAVERVLLGGLWGSKQPVLQALQQEQQHWQPLSEKSKGALLPVTV